MRNIILFFRLSNIFENGLEFLTFETLKGLAFDQNMETGKLVVSLIHVISTSDNLESYDCRFEGQEA